MLPSQDINLPYKTIKKREQNIFSQEPTPLICLTNVGFGGLGGVPQPIVEAFLEKYEGYIKVIMTLGKPFCFVWFSSAEYATAFKNTLDYKPSPELSNKHLFIEFANPEILQTSNFSTNDVADVPGLTYIDDFITEEEEATILENAQNFSSWEVVKNRFVKHYGWTYDYKKFHAGLQLEQGFPSYINPILDRFYALPVGKLSPKLNQLTISHYPIGAGIPPHCDSHTAFYDTILLVSLASSVLMEFRSGSKMRILHLRRRSLTVLQRDARYGWEHAIRLRKSDLLPSGELLERQVRVSLTLRRIQESPNCNCSFPNLCDRNKIISSQDKA
ncbi:Alkylated DNA repair protein alkB 8, variant 2 [Entomophthora muscae]|uniref:Alkylated DNA repair protein alkB 8, variant 2 n=2 Tax=Entomophthora muscae TaxID=34485 RepID=A0ACC2SZX0_9FUNG|nr:Alkylated DNA repair protein alkB 8, variant 2 [Entomophthora muscae]